MSFRLKTVLGIALIEALLLALLVWSSLQQLTLTGEHQLMQRAHTTATLFATATSDALLSYDLASLESFVEEIMRNPGVVYARIKDGAQVLAAAGTQPAGLFKPDSGLHTVNDGVFDVAASIEIAGTYYGKVELGLDIEQMQQDITDALRRLSGIASIELFLSALFSIVLGTLLTRQLGNLILGTRAVREGKFGYQVAVRGNDEIARATTAFNEMSLGLKNLMSENERQHHVLQENALIMEGLISNLQGGILLADKNGHVQHVNAGFINLFDLPLNPHEMLQKDLRNISMNGKALVDFDKTGQPGFLVFWFSLRIRDSINCWYWMIAGLSSLITFASKKKNRMSHISGVVVTCPRESVHNSWWSSVANSLIQCLN
jgi:PAS domain-containing protein